MQRSISPRPRSPVALAPRAPVAAALTAALATALAGTLACGSDNKSDPLEETLLAKLEPKTHGMEGVRFTIATPANYDTTRSTSQLNMPLIRFSHPDRDAQRAPSFVLEMQDKEGQFPVSAYMVEKKYGPEQPGASIETLEPLAEMKNGWLMVTRKPGPGGFVRVRSFWDANSRFALHCISEHQGDIDPRALDLMKRVCGSLAIQYQIRR